MKIRLELTEYHPGLPGYDARYSFQCFLENEKLEPYCCRLSASEEGMRIYGLDAVIPYSVRKEKKQVTIRVLYTPDPSIRNEYTLAFPQFGRKFYDDFDGDKLNTAYWRNGWPWGGCLLLTEDSAFVDDLAYVKDHCLTLPLQKGRRTIENKFLRQKATVNYAAPCVYLMDKTSLTYGAVMFRARMPQVGGTEFSAWLTVKDEQDLLIHPFDPDNSRSGEFNIMHYSPCWGEEYSIGISYYCPGRYAKYFGKNVEAPGVLEEYKTYGLVRTPEGIYFYCDGRLVYAHHGVICTSSAELFLIFSYNYGVKEGVSAGGNFDDSMLPTEVKIDWVAMYDYDAGLTADG